MGKKSSAGKKLAGATAKTYKKIIKAAKGSVKGANVNAGLLRGMAQNMQSNTKPKSTVSGISTKNPYYSQLQRQQDLGKAYQSSTQYRLAINWENAQRAAANTAKTTPLASQKSLKNTGTSIGNAIGTAAKTAINNTQPAAAKLDTSSGPLGVYQGDYDTYKQAQQDAFNVQDQMNAQNRDTAIRQADQGAQIAANNAYINMMKAQLANKEIAASRGITGGGVEKMQVADANAYAKSVGNVAAGKAAKTAEEYNEYNANRANLESQMNQNLADKYSELAQANIQRSDNLEQQAQERADSWQQFNTNRADEKKYREAELKESTRQFNKGQKSEKAYRLQQRKDNLKIEKDKLALTKEDRRIESYKETLPGLDTRKKVNKERKRLKKIVKAGGKKGKEAKKKIAYLDAYAAQNGLKGKSKKDKKKKK